MTFALSSMDLRE
jgi:hypothetical protein